MLSKLYALLPMLIARMGPLSIASLSIVFKIVGLAFTMPSVADAPAFREWSKRLAEALVALAGGTANTLDDQIAAAFVKTVNSDNGWAYLYSLLTELIDGKPILGCDGKDCICGDANAPHVLAIASATAIDPATIFATIQMIVQLIQQFRKK